MTTDLSKEEAREIIASENDQAVSLLPMERVEFDTITVEYTIKDGVIIYHFFRPEGLYWTWEFKDVLRVAFINSFSLKGREEKLSVEFIQELYSWCVRVFGIVHLPSLGDNSLKQIARIVHGLDTVPRKG